MNPTQHFTDDEYTKLLLVRAAVWQRRRAAMRRLAWRQRLVWAGRMAGTVARAVVWGWGR